MNTEQKKVCANMPAKHSSQRESNLVLPLRATRPRLRRLFGASFLLFAAGTLPAACGSSDPRDSAPGMTPASADSAGGNGAGMPEPSGGNLLLEESSVSSAHDLIDLVLPAEQTVQVQFELSGAAQFEDGATTLTREFAGDAQIELPPLRMAGAADGGVRVLIDGQVAIDHLRILSVPTDSVQQLAGWDGAEGKLVVREHDALLDDRVLDQVLGQCQSLASDPQTAQDGEIGTTKQALSLLSLCLRTPLGPGKVKWKNNSGFLVIPEGGGGLRAFGSPSANGKTQSVDAIWHPNFGCSVLKIPDDCTATVSSASDVSCCCNAAASISESGRCRFTSPAEAGAVQPPGCG